MTTAQTVTIAIDETQNVSGLWRAPPGAQACLVLAHGAGAGMTHKSMIAIADGLAGRGVATLRYQFPYMERGSKRTDPPRSRTPPCARRSPKPRGARRSCRCSPAVDRSAGA